MSKNENDKSDLEKNDQNRSDNLSDVKGFVGDTLKKVLTTAVTGAFMTEEALRNYLGEIKLPKEILGTIIQGAQKSKDEVTARVTKEIVGVIQKIDFVKEVSKFAETHKFKITAEIDIIKKETSSSKDDK